MKICARPDHAWTLAGAVWLSLAAALSADAVPVTFREGTSGYGGTQDTYIDSSTPAVSYGISATVRVDNNGPIQGLMRFDGIIGNGPGQIPPGSVINSATITFDVTDNASASAIVGFHRMLAAWGEASTWNSLGGGVSTNDVEAQSAADGIVADPSSVGQEIVGGLAPTVQTWSDGAANHGWVIISDQNNDWAFRSSENGTAALRPLLTVDYTPQATFAGRVFEDADFGGVASAWDGGAGDVALAGVDVELYTSGNVFVADTTTDASGLYAFQGVTDGDYRVRVRSGTIGDSNTPPAGGFNAACGITDPATGAACVLPELVWANGAALYGGQNPTLDDTATANDAGPGDTWIPVTAAGAVVTGLDFGFAYNAIVHAGDSGQGSLRQFLANANAIGGAGGTTASSAELRMQVPANQSSGGDSWWRITVASALPPLTDDGTALDGSTQRANSGTDSNSRGPELEIRGNGVAAAGLDMSASSDNTLREIVVNGFSGDGIRIGGAGADRNAIHACYVGTDAVGGSAVSSNSGDGIRATAAVSDLAASSNLIARNGADGIDVQAASSCAVYHNT
ncbi:MAG: DNRLRE domain-containing protein, partial [bacterium]